MEVIRPSRHAEASQHTATAGVFPRGSLLFARQCPHSIRESACWRAMVLKSEGYLRIPEEAVRTQVPWSCGQELGSSELPTCVQGVA